MVRLSETIWQISHPVVGPQPPDVSGLYTIRLVVNHSPQRQLKTTLSSKANGIWDLLETCDGRETRNINFKVDVSQSLTFRFDSSTMTLAITPSAGDETLHHIDTFESFELNGFPWDDLDMFEKFDCRIRGREFVQTSSDVWSIDVPLRKDGGIDFRADGVYQFLISSNRDEDYGFSGFNDGSNTLVQGTGFGSSHGTSKHSGCTVQVFSDGLYRFNLHSPESTNPKFSVEPSPSNPSLPTPKVLNQRESYQLLGSIFADNQFDQVSIIYNQFVNAITQNVVVAPLIPANVIGEQENESLVVYDYEPEQNELLELLLPRNITTQIFSALLESSAAELAARMTAMDNATRNAGDMIDSLTLVYNRTRQANITKELIEIISGAEAL